MGFFSWKTSDTNVSISNKYSSRGAFPVYLLIPEEFGGGYIEEDDYEGYGIFGGRDAYALVAQWNCPEKCIGEDEADRMVGIDIACYDKQNMELKYPIKITEHPMKYEAAAYSPNCPDQGFFYPEDEDETWFDDEDDDDEGYDEEDEDDE